MGFLFVRGQLFSMDLLIALAVLSAVIGFALQSAEFSSLRLSGYAELQSNAADAIAEANVSGRSLGAFVPESCKVLKNTTHLIREDPDGCLAGFNSQKCFALGKENVFVARRIHKCPSDTSACLLEVRTCE
ncbi:MAG: hypothetical protein WC792_05645 [Candidatus Micrarchaeia archaeon]|jgi:hypothetical protein